MWFIGSTDLHSAAWGALAAVCGGVTFMGVVATVNITVRHLFKM